MKRPATSRSWWHEAVVYEIYPRSFADGDSDGFGDLKGIISKLDYLRFVLGVDALWIRSLADHAGIAPVFGTMNDFEKLLTQARRRDLRVLVDFVPNRTSDQHPWFLASRSSRHDPKRDWYIWADPTAPDGRPPSNWTDESGEPSWTYHWHSDQYYLRSFHRRQPIVNWRNPEVQRATLAALGFWLDTGVDGIHVDIAHAVAPTLLREDTPRRGPIDLRPLVLDAKPLSDQLAADAHACLRMVRQTLAAHTRRTGRDIAAIDHGEMTPQDHWGRFPDSVTGTHLPFNHALAHAPWTAAGLTEAIEETEAALPPQAWPHHAFSHHDRPRLATRLGADHARVAALLLLTLRGMPSLCYGDELGLPELRLGPGDRRNPLGRHRSHAPMAWTGAPGGGFSRRPVSSPWLPLAEPVQQYNVEAQLADPHSLLNLYRRLIALRRRTPALRFGDYLTMPGAPPDCLCFLRTAAGRSVLVAVNFGGRPQQVHVPEGGRTLVSTTDVPSLDTFVKHHRLEPRSGAVIELAKQDRS